MDEKSEDIQIELDFLIDRIKQKRLRIQNQKNVEINSVQQILQETNQIDKEIDILLKLNDDSE